MRKIIDINDTLVTKLKILSIFENLSVKALIEKAVESFVNNKEKERFDNLTAEDKEDLGLLLLMQQVDKTETVSKEDFFKALNE
ncbi:MAG: hypothetical protein GW827_13645 [Flavobacteriales bacterium]|nr:hypothetical protein [Flavobacteriales bacterium]NCP91245.1 hypothetical protein [Flavobacteriales bacterium]NCQ15993.1 hypothetical protein [Flavobacteriales bacterium]